MKQLKSILILTTLLAILTSCNNQPAPTPPPVAPAPPAVTEVDYPKERLDLIAKILEQTAGKIQQANPEEAAVLRITARRLYYDPNQKASLPTLNTKDAKAFANAFSKSGNTADAKDWEFLASKDPSLMMMSPSCEAVLKCCAGGNDKCCILALDRCN